MRLMELPCPHCTSLFCGISCRFTMEERKAAPQDKTPEPAAAAPITEQTIVDIARHCGAI